MSCQIIKSIRCKRAPDGRIALTKNRASSNDFSVGSNGKNGCVAYSGNMTYMYESKKSIWEEYLRLCKNSGTYNGVYSAHDYYNSHPHWYYKNYTTRKSILHMLASELMKIKGA